MLALVAAARIVLAKNEYENHKPNPWGLMDWKQLNELHTQTVRVTDSSGTVHTVSIQPQGKGSFVVHTGQDNSPIEIYSFSIKKDVVCAQVSHFDVLVIARLYVLIKLWSI